MLLLVALGGGRARNRCVWRRPRTPFLCGESAAGRSEGEAGYWVCLPASFLCGFSRQRRTDAAYIAFSPFPCPFPLSECNKAVRRGSTVVGIQGKDCVVIAVEKRAIAKYVEASLSICLLEDRLRLTQTLVYASRGCYLTGSRTLARSDRSWRSTTAPRWRLPG
jgi:Proteasome subunit